MTPRPKRAGARSAAAATKTRAEAGLARHKVLILDDSEDERVILGDLLRTEGFSVLNAESGIEAFQIALDSDPDVVVSDVSMPEEDGISFAKRLRANPDTADIPILLISGSKKSLDDQIAGHEFGADDYLTKPFSHKLLVSKIRAAIRRRSAKSLAKSVTACGIELDLAARTVSARGRAVKLTRKEFDLLTTLLRRPDRILSIPYLLETVWGYDPASYNDPATVHSHVSNLRRKLGLAAAKRIISLPGLGYRFSPDPA